MNFIKAIRRATALAIATASIAVQAAPARATPTYDEAWEDHIELARVIQDHGVMVHVNPPHCKEGDFMGFYSGQQRVIVICQENGQGDYAPYRWTGEDFDTLRHEAQHFVQDCMVGTRHDHQLSPVYQDPLKLGVRVLGTQRVQRILDVYRGKGASEEILILEVEAFAVAALIDTEEQANDIRTYCGLG
jgi:hypothetical protein